MHRTLHNSSSVETEEEEEEEEEGEEGTHDQVGIEHEKRVTSFVTETG